MNYVQEFQNLAELFSHLRALVECVAELSVESEYPPLKEILFRVSSEDLEDIILSVQKLARYLQFEPELDTPEARLLLDLMEGRDEEKEA